MKEGPFQTIGEIFDAVKAIWEDLTFEYLQLVFLSSTWLLELLSKFSVFGASS
jgi:hypothetical protein